MDADTLSMELSRRSSRMWKILDPHALAEWVFATGGDDVEPVHALPGAAERVDGLSGDAPSNRTLALAVAGVMIRATVPAAVRTAAAHWLLTEHVQGDWEWLRLTVGVSEVLIVGWSGDELEVTLRVAASPIEDAVRRGQLDEAKLQQQGVQRAEEDVRSFADDAVRYRCEDLPAALDFLGTPVVVTAARLLNARLTAASFPHAPHRDPALAAEAWAAAEVVLGGSSDGVVDRRGFDRPYAGGDALCQRLVDQLGRAGITAGQGLAGIPADLAWRDRGGRQCIAHVVGTTAAYPLRLGLGQVIEYRARLAPLGVSAHAILLVPTITDPAWRDIAGSVDVLLLAADDPAGWSVLTAARRG
jgi:hypothetical protein